MNPASESSLQDAIDSIEMSYEFMLAYAAQGRDFEDAGTGGPSIRQRLTTLDEALGRIGDLVDAVKGPRTANDPVDAGEAPFGLFAGVLRRDAERARAAVRVALSLPSISSQLVDNLNASIHLRALLADLFLIDEALKSSRRVAGR